jgi:DNA-binding response OmpR family regulator
MRILIVEDDLPAADAMERGLTEAGHVCTRAPTVRKVSPPPAPASST